MRYSLCVLLMLASTASAQTLQRPGTITPPPATTSDMTEPLVVTARVPNGAAIQGNNTAGDQNSSGIIGSGYTGIVGNGLLSGGRFFSMYGTGISVTGLIGGIEASCGRNVCASISGRSPFGTGVVGFGSIGVTGVVTDNPSAYVEPLAGLFIGPVRITQDLRLEGDLHAPVIDALNAQIAALTARLDVLEGGPGSVVSQLPAQIEAENYDRGGPGVSYADSSPGNYGNVYRTDDVDIKLSAEGGYAVGWMTSGEWLAYTVNASEAGLYQLSARVGSALPARTIQVEVNETSLTADVPQMADWDQYGTVEIGTLRFEAGRQVIIVRVGAEDYVDLNYIKVSRVANQVTAR